MGIILGRTPCPVIFGLVPEQPTATAQKEGGKARGWRSHEEHTKFILNEAELTLLTEPFVSYRLGRRGRRQRKRIEGFRAGATAKACHPSLRHTRQQKQVVYVCRPLLGPAGV